MTDLLDDFDLSPAPERIELADRGRLMSLQWIAGDERLLADLLNELRAYRAKEAQPSTNGVHGYEAICFSCGTKFRAARRPAPGRRTWCETCRAIGEPAAQRARDFRERRRENA